MSPLLRLFDSLGTVPFPQLCFFSYKNGSTVLSEKTPAHLSLVFFF